MKANKPKKKKKGKKRKRRRERKRARRRSKRNYFKSGMNFATIPMIVSSLVAIA